MSINLELSDICFDDDKYIADVEIELDYTPEVKADSWNPGWSEDFDLSKIVEVSNIVVYDEEKDDYVKYDKDLTAEEKNMLEKTIEKMIATNDSNFTEALKNYRENADNNRGRDLYDARHPDE